MDSLYGNIAIPTMHFCEENLFSIIKTPANTWSNLAFIFIGLYLIFLAQKEKSLFLKFLGPITILCGIFSGLYHATFSYFWQIFDNLSMFLLTSYLFIFNLYRFKQKYLSTKNLISLYCLINFISLFIFFYQKTVLGINIGIIIFAI